MAYSFVGSSNQYLTGLAPVASAPLTISAWVWFNSTATNQAIVSLTAGNTAQRFLLYNSFLWFVNDTSFSQVSASVNLSGQWTHVCAVESASNSRTIYGNGIQGSTSSGSRNPANITELYIGIDRSNNSFQFPFTGRIADVGIWNTGLTAAEVQSLSRGVACRLVRPQNLVFYAPLIRDLNDLARGTTLTNVNGATIIEHPRIYS